MTGPLLAIDAATYRGTVAVLDGADVLAEGEAQMRGAHEERLMPAVADALRAAGVDLRALSGVVCGAGPGSFTSLRIAASIAKGIATAMLLPVYGVSSMLLIVAAGAPPGAGRYLAVLDAMRGDVFAALVTVGNNDDFVLEGDVVLVDAASAVRTAEADGLTMVGPGRSPAWWPHARGVARLDRARVIRRPVDLASWEPSYGRLAEAQVAWERKHGRSLAV